MNQQSIEKRRVGHDGSSLEVHSIFKTIQGEGPFTGHPAVFVRLTGCNLACPACDTDYTSTRTVLSPDDIVETVKGMTCHPLVVITGGEPFRQNIYPLVQLLIDNGHTVQIETNGTLPPPSYKFVDICSKNTQERQRCFIVCSPKTGKVSPLTEELACAFKYVLAHDSIREDDGLPLLALDHSATPFVARPPAWFSGPVYLQPCDDKDNAVNLENLRACVRSSLKFGYVLQLQVHKILGLE